MDYFLILGTHELDIVASEIGKNFLVIFEQVVHKVGHELCGTGI